MCLKKKGNHLEKMKKTISTFLVSNTVDKASSLIYNKVNNTLCKIGNRVLWKIERND